MNLGFAKRPIDSRPRILPAEAGHLHAALGTSPPPHGGQVKGGWVYVIKHFWSPEESPSVPGLAEASSATWEQLPHVKQIWQASSSGISWRVNLNWDAKTTCCIFIQKWELLHLFLIAGILRVATAPGKSCRMQGSSSFSIKGLKTLKKHPGVPVPRPLRWE